MNPYSLRAALLACFITASGMAAAEPTPGESQEAKLIAVLQSNAAPQDKAITCKRLAICGTKAAVPALAALLADEQLASWARIGLEAIPDPAVDAALREAAGKLKGPLQIGAINSLATRRDPLAVAWLAQQLAVADPALQAAAAAALGRIGGEPAAEALGQALTTATETSLPALCEGYLRAADAFASQGKQDQAAAIFSRVLAVNTPRHLRMEAMRGLIVARQAAGIPLLIEQLKSDDAGMVAVALGLAHELPGAELTKALAAEVASLPPAKQVHVIGALGGRRDRSVVAGLLGLTQAGSADVCIAAIGALTKLGDPAALPRLVEISAADDERAKAAQAALVAFPAADADASCLAMLASPNAAVRVTAADLISRRASYSAVPAVAVAARNDIDPAVRVGCIHCLRELGGAAQLVAMVEVLVKAPSPSEAQVAEQALAAMCGRQSDKAACSSTLVAGLATAQPAQMGALLRLLHAVADSTALQAVRAAMAHSNKDIQDTAMRLICNWSTAAAAPDLLVLAKSSPNPTFKVLALRGYLRVSAGPDVPAPQRVAMCRDAAGLVQRDEEKMILLGVLGKADDAESLAMAAAHLDNAALKAEAALATVSIAERLVKANQAAIAPVIEQVLKSSPDEKLTARANAVLKEAQAGKAAP
jgi:HEAT repeat protein